MTGTTLDVFTTELQRLYSLERELVSVLDALASDISIDSLDDLQVTDCRERLRERVETHRDETGSHLERLEGVFDVIDEELTDRHAPELDGWIADKEQFNNVILNDQLRPLYYLEVTKKLEEIEQSMYEPVLALTEQLENEDEHEIAGIVDAIERNVEEERQMLDDLELLADSEAVERLLGTSPVDSADRSALDRSGVNIETLEDLFVYQLQNVYYIERILADLFEEMATDTESDEFGETFADHADRTRTQVDHLEQVFETIGPRPTTSRNRTLDGLVESRRDRLESTNGGVTALFDLETALTAERVKSRCYEELLTLADRIGYPDDVVDLLTANLHEEHETISTLEEIAFEDLI